MLRSEMTTQSGEDMSSIVVRGTFGGVLMGLANLVPGISGGTMLLAAGVYTQFINGVAEFTTFRFRLRPFLLLSSIAVAAGAAILLLAGPVKSLVIDHRWIMYSLFVGLTLGGLPLVWRMARPGTPSVWIGATVGLGLMVWMVLSEARGGGERDTLLLFVAGVAGASAMILPGVSGAYLLIVLGQYEVILGAIDRISLNGDTLGVLGPVAAGVLVGVVGVSNLVKWALEHHEKPTLGVLLGLLVGAVPGIWPFQRGVPTKDVDPERWPLEFFGPTAGQIAASLALVGAGFLITIVIDRLGKGKRP